MKTLEGMYDGKGLKIAIVASRFNEFITTKLVGGAEDCLLRHGTDGDDITLAWVPGAFEIPLAAKKLVTELRQVTDLPIHLHTHDTSGNQEPL